LVDAVRDFEGLGKQLSAPLLSPSRSAVVGSHGWDPINNEALRRTRDHAFNALDRAFGGQDEALEHRVRSAFEGQGFVHLQSATSAVMGTLRNTTAAVEDEVRGTLLDIFRAPVDSLTSAVILCLYDAVPGLRDAAKLPRS